MVGERAVEAREAGLAAVRAAAARAVARVVGKAALGVLKGPAKEGVIVVASLVAS